MFDIDFKKLNIAGLGVSTLNFLPPLVAAGIVVGVSQNLAVVTWSAMPTMPEALAPIEQVSHVEMSRSTSVNDSQSNLNQLTNWHLFGEAKKALPKSLVVAPPPTETKDAPDTTLRLTLMGVMATQDMMDAWAIIGDRSGKEDNYRINSTLPGGATLKEIHTDRIILLHNGRLETLRLPKDNLPAAKNTSNRSSRSTRRSSRRDTSSRRSNQSTNQVSAEATRTLKDYRDKLINDPQSVMNAIRAEPYRQAGRLKGYRIFPGRDKNLFQQIGLEPGDVAISINGISLDNPLKGLEVMQNITDATEISMEILRNGVSQTFSVPLN